MKCPFCNHIENKVVDSREAGEGFMVRRRRQCLNCGQRFTTYERIEYFPCMVIKRDGRREPFDREKIVAGIIKACGKRPIGLGTIEEIVDDIERRLQNLPEREITSLKLGQMVMERLESLDEVAYIRFASVYRKFKGVDEFMEAIKDLVPKEE
ncbi:TPA: transcriptional regulator NrdR [bacterium]|nr:transcriptional regulator NrdR [bacterium]